MTAYLYFIALWALCYPAEALAYLEEFGITYPNGPDLRTKISQAYRIRGVPETFIIDQQGTIAHLQIGPFRSLPEILGFIDPLLD